MTCCCRNTAVSVTIIVSAATKMSSVEEDATEDCAFLAVEV